MNKKEQQIIDMMKALDISREEAEELVAFDNEEFELEEVNEMTEKAKKADKGTKRGRSAGTKMAGVTTQAIRFTYKNGEQIREEIHRVLNAEYKIIAKKNKERYTTSSLHRGYVIPNFDESQRFGSMEFGACFCIPSWNFCCSCFASSLSGFSFRAFS